MELVQTTDAKVAVDKIVALLLAAKERGGRGLLLVSGGSAIEVAVAVMRQLAQQAGGELGWLTLMQIDERFGPVGHADSNWQKLLDAGLELHGAEARPVLTGLGFAETVAAFEQALHGALAGSAVSVGLFGIGADGHTAGILPHAPAAAFSHQDLAAGYQGPDFERITMTPAAIAKLDAAVAYVMGDSKAAALAGLQTDQSMEDQPAQALKLAKHTWIFSDQIKGGTA